MKDDERELLRRLARGASLAALGDFTDRSNVAWIAGDLGMPPRRMEYILRKWTDKGWWNYGVAPVHGWLTDAGREAAHAEG